MNIVGLIITIIVAAIVYAICLFLGLPAIVGIIAAVLVLLGGIPSGGFGLGGRLGGGGRGRVGPPR